MPAIETTPPAEGSYKFVLRREDRYLQEHSIIFPCYDGNFSSRLVALGAKPPAHTLFMDTEPQRDRAVRLGWKDVTEEWNRTTLGRSKVLAALSAASTPSTAFSLAKVAGISTSDAQEALAILEAEGLAVQRGKGVALWSAPKQEAPPPVGESGAQAHP